MERMWKFSEDAMELIRYTADSIRIIDSLRAAKLTSSCQAILL